MGRKLEPKCKRCRREGEKLYLKGEKCFTAKCPVSRRAYPPGQHGPTGKSRPTPFGIQLREKQKAKNIYGIQERQFRNYFDKAKKLVGNTGEFLVQMLELRLDNVVFRLGFAKSRTMARQLVSHGHVRVNGKKVDIASYQVRPGDTVTLSAGILKSKLFAEEAARLEKYQAPTWMHMEAKEFSGKVLEKPAGDALKQNFDTKLIVEYYSR